MSGPASFSAGPSAQPTAPLRILIVGGGASGVLLAANLLRRAGGRVSVSMVEKQHMLGCGVAYSTRDPAHLLNTRVANMSAFPNEPEQFLDWLQRHGDPSADEAGFVSRATYGRYMRELLDPWEGSGLLDCRRAECWRIEMTEDGVHAHLENGEVLDADLAVLATGHALPDADSDPVLSQPGDKATDPCGGSVLIVGSGLSMVDQVLSLIQAGHQGPITAVSRRGLLPQVHIQNTPMCWRADELRPSPGLHR